MPIRLKALAGALPFPAFLLDAAGALRWRSDEGAERAGLLATAAPGGAGPPEPKGGAGTKALEPPRSEPAPASSPALAALAFAAAAARAGHRFQALRALRTAGLLRQGEVLVAHAFEQAGEPLVLLACTSANAGDRGAIPQAVSELLADPAASLTPAELAVATLASEGFTVTNMAARLGVRETTVRTHLRRLYLKLGVHSRAQLASLLLRGPGGRGR